MGARAENRRVRRMERELGYDDDWETPTRPDPPGTRYEIVPVEDDLIDGVILTILPDDQGGCDGDSR